jgi:hypothetical protein
MQKFYAENYRQTIRDLQQIMSMLETVRPEKTTGFYDLDTLLVAAIEVWKHQNPWIQPEYGEGF